MLSYPDLITATLLSLLKIKCVLKTGVDQIEQSEALEHHLMQKPKNVKEIMLETVHPYTKYDLYMPIVSTKVCLPVRRVSGSDLIRVHLHIRLKCYGSSEKYTIENVAAVVSKDGKQEDFKRPKAVVLFGGPGSDAWTSEYYVKGNAFISTYSRILDENDYASRSRSILALWYQAIFKTCGSNEGA